MEPVHKYRENQCEVSVFKRSKEYKLKSMHYECVCMYISFSLQALSQAKDDEISALCEEMKKRAEKEKSLMSELLEVKALKEELSKERNSLKVNWFETSLKMLFSFLLFSLSLRCIWDLRSSGIMFKAE